MRATPDQAGSPRPAANALPKRRLCATPGCDYDDFHDGPCSFEEVDDGPDVIILNYTVQVTETENEEMDMSQLKYSWMCGS